MKFGELKQVINRNPGRHEWVAINIGLGTDAIVKAESPMLDLIDDYEVAWICPSTIGENLVTDKEQPCIEVHLKPCIEVHLKPCIEVHLKPCIEVHLKEKKNPAEEVPLV